MELVGVHAVQQLIWAMSTTTLVLWSLTYISPRRPADGSGSYTGCGGERCDAGMLRLQGIIHTVLQAGAALCAPVLAASNDMPLQENDRQAAMPTGLLVRAGSVPGRIVSRINPDLPC